MMDERIRKIRESEKKSHTEIYSSEELYNTNSWLKKPIETIKEILPLFKDYKTLNVLDLGCGVGRNSIFIAQEYKNIDCTVECVDILDLAIEKLNSYAEACGVSLRIRGIIKPIEDYIVTENHYDLIISVSALEHVATKKSFLDKIEEIKNGICENGVVCLVINSEVRETDKETGQELDPQFEVNLPTNEIKSVLSKVFEGWTILKSTVQDQQYDVPRENGMCCLKTSVVSFVAQKIQ